MVDQPAEEKIELSEVMLAMDVVDTLRHERSIVERELQAEDREAELITKLKKIYADQGLTVSDDVIAQGVKAMHEDRFTYHPPETGLQTLLAHLYINRGRWAKRMALLALVMIGVWGAYQFIVVIPKEQLKEHLANAFQTIDALRTEALEAAREPVAADRIEALTSEARSAIQAGDTQAIGKARKGLQTTIDMLNQSYTIEVVSRPGTLSGVWRHPANNRTARNYYLIVEAISPSGQRLNLPITSEEDGSVRSVSQWGLRVDQQVFERVKQDKQQDGILDNRQVGQKQRGYLTPAYTITTTGAAITEW